MSHPSGHLLEHPLPAGIVGALGLSGYQLLADVGGVGAGRLGAQAFLVLAPDPPAGGPAGGAGSGPAADLGTQIVLHQPKLRDEAEAAAFVSLAAQLGFLRLSGYRVALERAGLRSRLGLVDPATGGVALAVPDKVGGRLFGGGVGAVSLLASARALSPAGPAPEFGAPDALYEVLLALALTDDSLGGAEAAEAADRALQLIRGDPSLAPREALARARP